MADKESQRLALRIGGGAMAFVYPIVRLWVLMQGSWPFRLDYEDVIVSAFFVTLGLFLLSASRDPRSHRSLIWFAVWVNVVYGAIMVVRTIDQPALFGHLMIGVLLILLIPTGGIAWATGVGNPRLMRWALRSVGAWVLIGLAVGFLVGNVMAAIIESDSSSPEGMGFAMARMFSPVAGALWGLFAGSIGAVVASASRSSNVYAIVMAIAAIGALLPFALGRAATLLVAGGTGLGLWLIARRFNPPVGEASHASDSENEPSG